LGILYFVRDQFKHSILDITKNYWSLKLTFLIFFNLYIIWIPMYYFGIKMFSCNEGYSSTLINSHYPWVFCISNNGDNISFGILFGLSFIFPILLFMILWKYQSSRTSSHIQFVLGSIYESTEYSSWAFEFWFLCRQIIIGSVFSLTHFERSNEFTLPIFSALFLLNTVLVTYFKPYSSRILRLEGICRFEFSFGTIVDFIISLRLSSTLIIFLYLCENVSVVYYVQAAVDCIIMLVLSLVLAFEEYKYLKLSKGDFSLNTIRKYEILN